MTAIYRFLSSLTELYKMLRSNEIKFSQLSIMEDPNEGLGRVLSSQESLPWGIHLREAEKFKEHHQYVQNSTYITSWTSESDLMAMWLLYSKDCSSIRIKSSLKKLKDTVDKYSKANFWTEHLNSPEGTIQLWNFGEVDSVQYASFEELSGQIKANFELYLDACVEYVNEDKAKEKREKEYHAAIKRFEEARIIDIRQSGFLKDLCFSHEKEVRGSFSICERNELPAIELKNPANHDKTEFVFGTATHRHNAHESYPKVSWVPVSDDFIEAICFDPRVPEYVRIEQEAILKSLRPELTIEKSQAFGYKPDYYDFSLEL